jgi:hypothetical protein
MTRMVTPRLLLVLLLATSTAAIAAKSKNSTMPRKPAALLAIATQNNGLVGPGLAPWHLHATYQLYNTNGKPAQKGTFNEWWAAPDEYKITFDRPHFHYVFYFTPQGAYYSKDTVPQQNEMRLLHWLVAPVPESQNLKGYTFRHVTDKAGHTHFDCLVAVPPAKRNPMVGTEPRMYCMPPGKPMLQFVETMNPAHPSGVFYKSIGTLQGRYIGLDLTVGFRKRPEVTAHVDSGQVLTHSVNSMFAPPPAEIPHLIHVPATAKNAPFLTPAITLAGKRFKYPYLAAMLQQQGELVITGAIGTDGNLHHLKVVSSPSPILTKSAMDWLHSLRYRPYKLSGVAIPVGIQIHVIYAPHGSERGRERGGDGDGDGG